MLSKRFVSHINLGTTFTPGAKSPLGEKADLSSWNFGQSFIWLARPTFNAMLEFAYSSGEQVAGGGSEGAGEYLLRDPRLPLGH